MPADTSALWSFSRAPLAGAIALLFLNVGISFFEATTTDPEPWCNDWLWCPEDRAVGLMLNRTPELHACMLAAIPTPFLAYAAAHIAGVRSGARRHWFMAPALLALLGTIIFCFIWPYSLLFFYDVSGSYPPAIFVLLLQGGIVLGTLSALAASFAALLCALAWRVARSGLRPRPQ